MNPRDFHRAAVVVDAHNDLPVLLLLRNATLGIHKSERFWSEQWVPEARVGGVLADAEMVVKVQKETGLVAMAAQSRPPARRELIDLG